MAEELVTERQNGVVVARLNRPQARNALNLALLESLADLLDRSARDNEVSVLVLGTTDPVAFSAGMDTKEALQAGQTTSGFLSDLLWTLASYPKPVVAALSGHVIGGGAELALTADIRIGGPTTQLRFPGTGYGLPQGSWHLVDVVGASWARQIVLTGRAVDAEDALRLGLIHELSGDPDGRALQVAGELAERSDAAMVESKRLILAAGGRTLKERFDEEALVTEELMRGSEVAGRMGKRSL